MIYKAIDLAKEAHKTQKRKDGSPYIEHPARVVHLLCLHEYPTDEMIAAAWLHDLIEDSTYPEQDLYRDFGPEVFYLVKSLTNVFTKENCPSWNRDKRKEAEAIRLGQCCKKVQLIKCADRIDNLQDIINNPESDFYTRYLAESVELYNSLTKIHNTRLGSIFNSLLGDNE